jgi:DNA-binding LytR/AlgR family response regulator
LVITAAMTAYITAVQKWPRSKVEPGDEAPPSSRFMERLPHRLRGAAVLAVAAEDHYLRVHTDQGQTMILMRLSDAVSELASIEGARTHRSWWVARAALADVERSDQRVVLVLKTGLRAPVSRSYAPVLRRLGWF